MIVDTEFLSIFNKEYKIPSSLYYLSTS